MARLACDTTLTFRVLLRLGGEDVSARRGLGRVFGLSAVRSDIVGGLLKGISQ